MASKQLAGTKTHTNLKDAFAGESQANRRYLYFAKVADVEGRPDVAGLFKDTADGETGHAHGHLDYLKAVGDPATGLPIGNTEKNLKSAVAGETHEYETMYPGMAKEAREEGFEDVAEWFETLAKAEKSHAGRFAKALASLDFRPPPPALPPRPGEGEPDASRHPRGTPEAHLEERSVSVIPRAPATPPAHSPHDPRYYEPRDLEAELRRAFQICHECRMCVGYCGSFPELFKRIDRDIDSGAAEGAEKLDEADIKAVGDQCWQCKLCYIKCPYTADEGASELLDFPRLMARERAARARRDGIPLVDRILGEPQLIGQLGLAPPPPWPTS